MHFEKRNKPQCNPQNSSSHEMKRVPTLFRKKKVRIRKIEKQTRLVVVTKTCQRGRGDRILELIVRWNHMDLCLRLSCLFNNTRQGGSTKLAFIV